MKALEDSYLFLLWNWTVCELHYLRNTESTCLRTHFRSSNDRTNNSKALHIKIDGRWTLTSSHAQSYLSSFRTMDVPPSSICEGAGQRSKALEDLISHICSYVGTGRIVSLIIYTIPTLHVVDASNSF